MNYEDEQMFDPKHPLRKFKLGQMIPTNNPKTEVLVQKDESNIIHFSELGKSLEAVDDKIIVLIDAYRSGLECSECKGTGAVDVKCICELSGTPGLRNRFGEVCVLCGGDYKSKRKTVVCVVCKGKKSLIVIPENARSLPSTGEILSVGPTCKLPSSKLHNHVVFGPHVGTVIPLKNVIRIKVMREHEILALVHSDEEDGSTINFIDYENDFSTL